MMPGPYFPDPAAEALRNTAFDSSGFSADENGNVLEMLRYIMENQGGRVHVGKRNFFDPATDFWILAWQSDDDDASTTAGSLRNFGWPAMSASIANSENTGDFLSEADPGFTYMELNAASEGFSTPRIFGGLEHVRNFTNLMGVAPTKLCAEWDGRFTNTAGNELGAGLSITGQGFSAIHLNANYAGLIGSNGANFGLKSASNTDLGAAVDTNRHRFKIEVTFGGSAEWFMDGASQGTIAIEADIWPQAFVGQVMAGGVNFNNVYGGVHIWYE